MACSSPAVSLHLPQHLLAGRNGGNPGSVALFLLLVLGEVPPLVPCPIQHKDPHDAHQVSPRLLLTGQTLESARQCQLTLAEVWFSLVAWARCLRLRQKMSLLHLNSPSPSILCPKATKPFTLSILKYPCTLLVC